MLFRKNFILTLAFTVATVGPTASAQEFNSGRSCELELGGLIRVHPDHARWSDALKLRFLDLQKKVRRTRLKHPLLETDYFRDVEMKKHIAQLTLGMIEAHPKKFPKNILATTKSAAEPSPVRLIAEHLVVGHRLLHEHLLFQNTRRPEVAAQAQVMAFRDVVLVYNFYQTPLGQDLPFKNWAQVINEIFPGVGTALELNDRPLHEMMVPAALGFLTTLNLALPKILRALPTRTANRDLSATEEKLIAVAFDYLRPYRLRAVNELRFHRQLVEFDRQLGQLDNPLAPNARGLFNALNLPTPPAL